MNLADRDLTVSNHSDTDPVLTACTSGADKGNQTVHTLNAWIRQTKGIRLFNHLLGANRKILRSVQCESMAGTAWLRSMHRRRFSCWIWHTQYVLGKPERLEQIVDVPVPQIEERDRRGGQIPSLCETVSGTGHSIQMCAVRVMCLSEHSSVRMHACCQLFLV